MFGSSSEGASMVGLAIRLIFSLALVLGLLLLISRVANRRFKGRSGAPIQVVHRQHLTRNTQVAVVTVGTRVLVLGTTDQHVTLLTEVEPDEVGLDMDDLEAALEPHDPSGTTPAAAVAKMPVPFKPGGLNGSILSPQTWRQTWEQVRPRTAGAPTDAPADAQAQVDSDLDSKAS